MIPQAAGHKSQDFAVCSTRRSRVTLLGCLAMALTSAAGCSSSARGEANRAVCVATEVTRLIDLEVLTTSARLQAAIRERDTRVATVLELSKDVMSDEVFAAYVRLAHETPGVTRILGDPEEKQRKARADFLDAAARADVGEEHVKAVAAQREELALLRHYSDVQLDAARYRDSSLVRRTSTPDSARLAALAVAKADGARGLIGSAPLVQTQYDSLYAAAYARPCEPTANSYRTRAVLTPREHSHQSDLKRTGKAPGVPQDVEHRESVPSRSDSQPVRAEANGPAQGAVGGVAVHDDLSCGSVAQEPPPLTPSPSLATDISDRVYNRAEVEHPARLLSGAPPVPSELGDCVRVIMGFVVDTLGRVEVGNQTVHKAASQRYLAVVRAALPSMIFSPASIRGRRVRQSVDLAFPVAP